MVARARHPRPVRGRRLVVVAEVPPYLGLHGRVQVRVAQIPVQQVKQRLEGLDGLDRVRALAVGEHPVGVRRGQVAEAGEAERRPAVRCGAEGGAERIRGVVVVVRGHHVRVRRAGPQPGYVRVIGPDRLTVDPVGVLPGLGRDDSLPDADPRPGRLAGAGPRDDDTSGRTLTPGEMDLLGGAVAGPGSSASARLTRPRGRLRGTGGGREQARAACPGQHLTARHRGPGPPRAI